MPTLTIEGTQFVSVYKIDNTNDQVTSINMDTTDSQQFITKVCIQDLVARNKKSFKYARNSSQLAQIIEGLVNNKDEDDFLSRFQDKTKILAEKLLQSQRNRISQSPNTKAPKEGSLAIILIKKEDSLEFIISKIDQAIFLEIEDSKYKIGLPEENATQKSCSITYKLQGDRLELFEILVSDTNSSISAFWSKDFLELEALNNNETNTLNAFNAIDSVLVRNVKKKSESDYTDLRNGLTGYFSTKTSFKLDDMIDYVIGEYTPQDPSVDIPSLKEKLRSLPENKKFDAAFDIDTKDIKKRFKQTYQITDKIELRTSDYIDDLKEVIYAKEDEMLGEKILVIKNISDKLYEKFKKRDES